MVKLVQVDPNEAVHIYKTQVKTMPRELVNQVLDRFIASGLKCCRVETDDYAPAGMKVPFVKAIKARNLRDIITLRQNLSKIYLIRK